MTKKIKVLITGKKHPHRDKVGFLTGKIIDTMWGDKMAEVEFTDGSGACFVCPGEARHLDDFDMGEIKRYRGIIK